MRPGESGEGEGEPNRHSRRDWNEVSRSTPESLGLDSLPGNGNWAGKKKEKRKSKKGKKFIYK